VPGTAGGRAQAAAGWDQDVLAAHGCWVCPRTGLRVAPSASMLDRLGKLLDPDELEGALSATVAAIALDPAVPAAYAAHRAEQQCEKEKEEEEAEAAGKANEVTHFVPLLAPLPLDDVLVTSDAMQATRDNALWLRKAKEAHYLWPILGNQPNLNAQLSALPWESTPVAAATSEISRGRIETRTIRVLPSPADTGFEDARQALLIERYTTYRKNGQWRTRAEAVLYLTSLGVGETTPEDLLAHVRGHWRVEHAHWLRDVIWKEDKSLIRSGNGPQIWSALANLVITLFRIHGVTRFAEETRRCAQDSRRALRLLGITCPSPG
jgi:predicted transposase YbfD/YdcC